MLLNRFVFALCLSLTAGLAAAGDGVLLLPRDINFEDNSASPKFITDAGGAVFFSAGITQVSQSGSLITVQRLWVSDGTEEGTLPLSGAPVNTITARDPDHLAMVDGTVFFSARSFDETSDPVLSFGRELWRSGGTSATTVMVADLHPGSASSNPTNLVDVGGTLFFAASTDNGAGRELWKSDGLPGGETVMVKDINPGSAASIGAIATPIDVNETLFFWADDGVHGFELWKSDGTAGGTELVKDINETPGASSIAFDPNPGVIIGSRVHRPFNPLAVGAALYFLADDGVHGTELWRSDGTAENTVMVADIHPGGPSDPAWLIEAAGTIFFTADDGVSGRELWKTEATVQGTVTTRVADIRAGFDSSRDAGHDMLVAIGETVYFAANDGVNGTALWRSDGTDEGTFIVADLHPGNEGFEPVNKLTRVGNGLFFAADDGVAGVELWYSDGTDPGTRLASDINIGPDDSIGLATGPRPIDLVASAGRLFLPAFEPDHGDELWVTAGSTPDGFDTTRTRPLDAPPPDPQPGPDIGVILSVRAGGFGTVDSGDLFVMVGDVYNNGPGTAFGILLSSVIGAGGGHFDSTEFCIPPANPDGPPAIVKCLLGNLPEGVVRKAFFLGRAPEVATMTRMDLTHSVLHSGIDPDTFNNFSRFTAVVRPPPPPPVAGVDLEVALLDLVDPVLPGSGIQYRIAVFNRGPDQASGVELTGQLPPEADFQSIASSPEGVCSEAGGTVTCLLGVLAKDAVATVDIVARAPLDLGTVQSTATVMGDQVDTDEDNNTATESTAINETFFVFDSGFESM